MPPPPRLPCGPGDSGPEPQQGTHWPAAVSKLGKQQPRNTWRNPGIRSPKL